MNTEIRVQGQRAITAGEQPESIYDVLSRCDLWPSERKSKPSVHCYLLPVLIFLLSIVGAAIIWRSAQNHMWSRVIVLIAAASAILSFHAKTPCQCVSLKRKGGEGEAMRIQAEHDFSNVARLGGFSRRELEDAHAALTLSITKSRGLSDYSTLGAVIAAITILATIVLDLTKPEGRALFYIAGFTIVAVLTFFAIWIKAGRSSLRQHYYLSLLDLARDRFEPR